MTLNLFDPNAMVPLGWNSNGHYMVAVLHTNQNCRRKLIEALDVSKRRHPFVVKEQMNQTIYRTVNLPTVGRAHVALVKVQGESKLGMEFTKLSGKEKSKTQQSKESGSKRNDVCFVLF